MKTSKEKIWKPYLLDPREDFWTTVREEFKKIKGEQLTRKEYMRQYYLTHKDEYLDRQRKYREKKKKQARQKEYMRQYYIKNKERLCSKKRKQRVGQIFLSFIDRIKLATRILIKGE